MQHILRSLNWHHSCYNQNQYTWIYGQLNCLKGSETTMYSTTIKHNSPQQRANTGTKFYKAIAILFHYSNWTKICTIKSHWHMILQPYFRIWIIFESYNLIQAALQQGMYLIVPQKLNAHRALLIRQDTLMHIAVITTNHHSSITIMD